MEKRLASLIVSTIMVALILTVCFIDNQWIRFGHEDNNSKTDIKMGLWLACSTTSFTFNGETKERRAQCYNIYNKIYLTFFY